VEGQGEGRMGCEGNGRHTVDGLWDIEMIQTVLLKNHHHHQKLDI
jgi:hypothetical protein